MRRPFPHSAARIERGCIVSTRSGLGIVVRRRGNRVVLVRIVKGPMLHHRAAFRWAFYLWRSRHNCTNEGHVILPQGRCAACGVIPAVLEPPSAEAVREHALK